MNNQPSPAPAPPAIPLPVLLGLSEGEDATEAARMRADQLATASTVGAFVIVGNMLSNAVKYHDPQEAEPVIDVRAFRYSGKVRLSVEDNGLGVPPASRHLLFKMFKRLHPNRSFGSGLGLYILKKSAESLGGDALYEARDKGSRFIIELPDRDKHEDHLDPGRR